MRGHKGKNEGTKGGTGREGKNGGTRGRTVREEKYGSIWGRTGHEGKYGVQGEQGKHGAQGEIRSTRGRIGLQAGGGLLKPIVWLSLSQKSSTFELSVTVCTGNSFM